MRKTMLLLTVLTAINILGCKSEKKERSKEPVTKKSTAAYTLSEAKNNIEWTAYKTTEKIPVKGTFKKVNITSGGEGNTVKEAINNSEFSIPVSSIFTSDTSRDFKIRKFFFNVMDNTKLLSGKLVLENDSTGYANITMNGVTEKLPFTYTVSGKEFSMTGTMNILDWNAKNAVDSLNVACKDLHKGLDGVSKTWTEVALTITSAFK